MKHLSYRQFKNIFGDWGVTVWVKFNWLSNGLPDGTYNGITKVTIKTITNINNKRALINSVMPIAPADNNTVWQYGYASLKIISGNASYQGVPYNNVSVDANGYMFIQIPSIAQTKEAYEEYLNKYPVVFYFYDRRTYGAYTITQDTTLEPYSTTGDGNTLYSINNITPDMAKISTQIVDEIRLEGYDVGNANIWNFIPHAIIQYSWKGRPVWIRDQEFHNNAAGLKNKVINKTVYFVKA